MLNLAAQIAEAVAAIRLRWDCSPKVGIILGTGLGSFARDIAFEAVLSYEEIPHFARSTATGHAGQLVCGRVADISVVTMEGRFHAYEGYSLQQITLPVRVMKALGVELLIISNASGGLNSNYQVGDIVVIDDHINLFADNPLVGVNDEQVGTQLSDMSRPYDAALVDRALAVARRENIVAHRGVYLALKGPTYETRAEYRFLRTIGADVVGMSTVPEVIVARHAGLRVLALSVVTNVCRPDALNSVDCRGVIAAADAAEPKMRRIVKEVLLDLGKSPDQKGMGPSPTIAHR